MFIIFSKDVVKDEKDLKEGSSRARDFQAQFLEFNQRQKTEKEEEDDKTSEEKEKEKSEVVQIAAMLQGTETMSVR